MHLQSRAAASLKTPGGLTPVTASPSLNGNNRHERRKGSGGIPAAGDMALAVTRGGPRRYRACLPTLRIAPLAGSRASREKRKNMNKDETLLRVFNTGVVAVVRASSGELLVDVAHALLEGGVDAIEITFTVPGAAGVLERVAGELGGRIALGAGTVLDTETARTAILAGADFVVSPVVNTDVIRLCRRYSKAIMPGALTPTEVLSAWEAGADVVKVFPSDLTGPSYLKALHGPLPQVKLMPTGGVNLETTADFIRAGACAVGAGSSLVEKQAVEARDFGRITSLSREFVAIVKQTRAAMVV